MKNRVRAVCFALACCILVVASVAAQSSPSKLLTDSDVKKFIATLKPMAAEFEALGDKYESDLKDGRELVALIDAMRADGDVKRIVRKYGWGDDFFPKYGALIAGYVILAMETAGDELEAEMEKARTEVESNPDLTRAQKDELLTQLSQAGGLYGYPAGNPFADSIHPDDVKLVGKYRKEISAAFEDM